MIGGVAKAYGWTPDYVLNEMSYANMILYSAVLPSASGSKKDKKEIKSGNNEVKTGMNTQTLFGILKNIQQ